MLYPTPRLAAVVSAWALLGLLPSVWPALLPIWWGVGIVVALLIAWDLYQLLGTQRPLVERQLPPLLSLGAWHTITLHTHNPNARAIHIQLHDQHPASAQAEQLPQTLTLEAGAQHSQAYSLRPLERGQQCFSTLKLRVYSPWQGWQRQLAVLPPHAVQVYPYGTAQAQKILYLPSPPQQVLGIQRQRRRGSGNEFHQLRDWQDGDSLRQVEWKASARHRRLLSRDYQDERDQRVIILLDCGQQLRTQDGELSHFDHCLNALLQLTVVALRQGDAVGLLTLAGPKRWLAPSKQLRQLDALLNQIYDLQPSWQVADYTLAAQELLQRHPRRTLVIVLTSFRDEDSGELARALRMLSAKQRVMLANLREGLLDELATQTAYSSEEQTRWAALGHTLLQRDRALANLQACGVQLLDCRPEQLTQALIARYLALKSAGGW